MEGPRESAADSARTPLISRWQIDEDTGSILSGEDPRSSLAGGGSRTFEGEFGQRLKRAVPRVDSLDVEAMQVPRANFSSFKGHTLVVTLRMAYDAIGVIYGDMGTSPLYVYSSAFNEIDITGSHDILGALSIIIYTLTLIPLIKYTLVVLRANSNGDGDFKGGTFSLYSLICRYAKVSLIPNRQPADEQLSNFKIVQPTKRLERALRIKEKLEKNIVWKNVLLIITLLGAGLVMGNGILTPCISVMSAVSGLRVAVPSLSQDIMLVIAIVILIVLFSVQRFGTGKVGLLFAPVLCVWFAAIGAIGICNIIYYDPTVFQAFNPAYIFYFFIRNKAKAWHALGGLVLCIAGGEAMFADLGNFSVKSVQIAFCFFVYPCLLLAYMGQAAYLLKYPDDVDNAFYNSIPGAFFWPMFVMATFAAIIASQTMIMTTFSVIKMALALECFPRVKIIHTSRRFMGQVYIPVINWFLMIMCVLVTFFFRTIQELGHAYGVAVLGDMLVTTGFVTLIMLLIWQTPLLVALAFALVIGAVELIYLTAVLQKIDQGGWVPLVLALTIFIIMYIWHYGTRMKYQSEVEQRISMDYMLELGSNLGTIRVPGVGLLYNELVHGVPAIFGYFIKSLPATHSTIVFVCIKYVPVPVVPQSERFLFRRVCPRDYHLFRCVARYGYKDFRKEDHYIFEQLLLQSLEIFIQKESQEFALELENFGLESDDSDRSYPPYSNLPGRISSPEKAKAPLLSTSTDQKPDIIDRSLESSGSEVPSNVTSGVTGSGALDDIAVMELTFLRDAKEAGVVYLLGHADVRAKKQSWFIKKLVINYFYAFLARNCRAPTEALSVPHTHLMQVGMTYMV